MGWRKGADVDQELWPVEAFGGVTDEQFWDDLAADKPLATTARTAQPDSDPRKRPHDAVPQQAGSLADRRPEGSGAYLRSRPGSADRTAMQPIQAAYQPAESRGRARPGTGLSGTGVSRDEDPLTSPAYALRPKGAVDGRSYQSSRRSDGYRSDPLRPGGSRSGPAGSPAFADTIATQAYRPGRRAADAGGSTAGYSYLASPEQPYREPIQTMSTPPYGDTYGYGNPADPAGDSRRPNGTAGYVQPGYVQPGYVRGSRNAYPPAGGYRGGYDPRGNGRRLGDLCLPLAHWGHARGRRGLEHRPPPAYGAGGTGADPQRLPGPAAGHR